MGGRGPKDQLGTRRRHSWAWHGSPQLTGLCLRPANCELWMQGQVVLRPWPQRCCPAERLLPEHCQDLARTADRAVLPGVGQNSRKEDKGQRRSITPECPPPALGSTSERGKRVQTSIHSVPSLEAPLAQLQAREAARDTGGSLCARLPLLGFARPTGL